MAISKDAIKLLIVGSDTKWAIENDFIKHLKDSCNVSFFNARGNFLNYYQKSIINKLLFRFGFSTILKTINLDLLKQIEQKKPTIIWVFKGMEIYPKTLQKIKQQGIILANYNPDHPFLHTFRGTGNKNVLESVEYYHHHFSFSKKVVDKIQKEYELPSSWLPFAYVNALEPKTQNVENKVCFIGYADPERARVISLILENDIPVDVYGENWGKFLKNDKNLGIKNSVYKDEFTTVAQNYRIQLNMFRPHNIDSHNMRTFEMPALGCIMLAPYSIEHAELFEEGKEAFYYKNELDLIEKCNYLTNLSTSEAYQLGLNAYNKSISSDYSYKNRTKQVLNCFIKLAE